MAYFDEHYLDVRLPVKRGDEPTGLRRAQLGAIHAVASHFSLRHDPALVVMPTGSGKTAVLMISAYMLEAKRVLVVTPSRLVRNQIAELFRQLTLLRTAGVIPATTNAPRVHELTQKVTTDEGWAALAEYDVVVATPQSASPALEDIPTPPADLFDLILVDEAHHSPARTWNDLFSSFPAARRLLVTATPFRRDRREIKGRFAFVYHLKEAYRDNVFGQIEFIAVEPGQENHDVAIARAAEQTFIADRTAGLQHYLMVRTDSRNRADELKTIYGENTGLRLRTIHSNHSYRYIKDTITQLRNGNLDGIICVNMLGEGFDFPNLKIAAIHAPHKSLAVTLQFIGRFSRTNTNDIDRAKFLAVPSDIEIESLKLYEDGAVWQEMVINLSGTRIDQEVHARNVIEQFHEKPNDDSDEEDISLFTLRPFCHVKIYRMSGTVDLNREPHLPKEFEVEHRWDSEEPASVVLVAREITKPRWSTTDRFASQAYHLFVIFYDPQSRLLFINSTLRHNELYEELARSFTDGSPKILPLNQINKVLLGIDNPAFWNVGMKNRIQSATAESYRTLTGPGAQNAISQSDGQLYHRGHVYGGDDETTIGFSSSSKVWTNEHKLIPALIDWCQEIATHICSNREVVTNSPLDYLHTGKTITSVPEGVLGAIWDIDAFKRPPRIRYRVDQDVREISLLDIELSVDQEASTDQTIRLTLSTDAFRIDLDYLLNGDTWFTAVDANQLNGVWVERTHSTISLLDYLNANPTEFFFSDFSRLLGTELFPGPIGPAPSIRDEQFCLVDWVAKNVDIRVEFGQCDQGSVSIHDCLKADLPAVSDIVFYDHGSGEVADFITFDQRTDDTVVSFFHCKKSSGDAPGQRTKDYYEVCMQVIKSLQWIENGKKLIKHIEHRSRLNSRFVKGDLANLKELMAQTRHSRISYRLVIVQPGIKKSSLAELAVLLAATGDYVSKSRGQSFEVWCTA